MIWEPANNLELKSKKCSWRHSARSHKHLHWWLSAFGLLRSSSSPSVSVNTKLFFQGENRGEWKSWLSCTFSVQHSLMISAWLKRQKSVNTSMHTHTQTGVHTNRGFVLLSSVHLPGFTVALFGLWHRNVSQNQNVRVCVCVCVNWLRHLSRTQFRLKAG